MFWTALKLIWTAIIIAAVIGWFMNLYKLSQCDFEYPYKAEIIHSVGIVPMVGAVTGWLDLGK